MKKMVNADKNQVGLASGSAYDRFRIGSRAALRLPQTIMIYTCATGALLKHKYFTIVSRRRPGFSNPCSKFRMVPVLIIGI